MVDEHGTAGEDGSAIEPVPWDAGRARAVVAFFQTLRAVLLHPFDFFSRVGHSGDRWSALGFALIAHVLGFGGAALWHLALSSEQATLALIRVLIAPLWVLVSVWLGSELMHGFLGMLRGTTASRAVTHRAVAYCYATAALGVVHSRLGILAGLAAAVVYQIIALKQAHRTEWWKAILAVLLTWGLVALGLLVLASGGEGADGPGAS